MSETKVAVEEVEAYEDLVNNCNCPGLARRVVSFRQSGISLGKDGESETLLSKGWDEYEWKIPPQDGYVLVFAFQNRDLRVGDSLSEHGEMRSCTFFPTEEQAAYNRYGNVSIAFVPVSSALLHDDNGQGKHPVVFAEAIDKVFLTLTFEELGPPSRISEFSSAIGNQERKKLLSENWSGPYFLGPFKECPDGIPLDEWIVTKNSKGPDKPLN